MIKILLDHNLETIFKYVKPSIHSSYFQEFEGKNGQNFHLSFYIMSFPCGSAGKESTCNVGDLGLIPGLGRSPQGEKGYPLQYSGLESFLMIFLVDSIP